MTLGSLFNGNFDPRSVFIDEASIRDNTDLFRAYCYKRLQDRHLPLSAVALNCYLLFVSESDQELRKDKKTPRILHELGHLDVMDRLLEVTNNSWIDEENFGSIDALFTAIILHDVIEDFNISPYMLEEFVADTVENLNKCKASDTELNLDRIYNDLTHAMYIVVLLSRKDAYGATIPEIGKDRVLQAKRWLEHPYAFPIKQIDWCSKLQAMAGVAHFEKDGFLKMEKVLDETALLFVTEQQDFTGQAISLYPKLREPCKIMEGFMGPMFQILRTYRSLYSERVNFNPKNAAPFKLNTYFAAAEPLLGQMLKGNNYFGPFIERLDTVGQKELKIKAMMDNMVKPAFISQKPHLTPLRDFSL